MKKIEIFNPERIALDEFIEKHGPENVIVELKSIFDEKAKDPKIGFAEKEAMANAFKEKEYGTVNGFLRGIFDEFGGAFLIAEIISMISDIKAEWEIRSERIPAPAMMRQLDKMQDALKTKTFKSAWGIVDKPEARGVRK